MNKRTLVSLATLGLILLSAGLLWFNRYDVYDWAKLRNYTAPAEVATLADQTAMTDYGRRLFYVNTPQISDKQQFIDQCKVREQTIVLGCYNGTNIYVFNVDDPKLVGVEQVTAAHEMLHVAYDRLSVSEKNRIDALLYAAYDRLKDQRLQELIAGYEKSEPGQTANELHSILGTEQRNLGPELEAYYKKYFTDRMVVVTYAENYQKVFDDLKAQVETYDADLTLRKSEIDRMQAELQAEASRLVKQKATMDEQINSGQIAAYNSQVNSYNSAVKKYNSEVAVINELINQFNAIFELRKAINIEQQTLFQSIDSRPSAISN